MKKPGIFFTIIFSYILLTLTMIVAGTSVFDMDTGNARAYVLSTGLRCIITVFGYLASGYVIFILTKKHADWSANEKEYGKMQMGASRNAVNLLFSAGSLAVLFLSSFFIERIIPGKSSPVFDVILSSVSGIPKIMVLLFAVLRHAILPAICEELYFRIVLILAFIDVCGFNFYGAAVLSSLLFCISHDGGIEMALFSFISGIIFCVLVRFSGSVRYSIAVHLLYNLTILLSILF